VQRGEAPLRLFSFPLYQRGIHGGLAIIYAKRQIPGNSPSPTSAVMYEFRNHKDVLPCCCAYKLFDFRNVGLLD